MQVFPLRRPIYRAARLSDKSSSTTAALRADLLQRWRFARQQGLSAAAAAAVVSVPRATLFRWERAWRRSGPAGLEPRSRCPRHVPQPRTPPPLRQRIQELREEFPSWGKKKLTVLLRREGHGLSQSTVGRVLQDLVRRGVVPPVRRAGRRSRSGPRPARPHAQRLGRGQLLLARAPGDAVQVDTLSVALTPGTTVKHFNAVDRVSRYNIGRVYGRATARLAAAFLDELVRDAPFPIRRIQVDGGSEFCADFEQACAARGIALHVLAPKSPKLNGRVERVNGTWRTDLYELYADLPTRLDELRGEVANYETLYNHVRPHEALDFLTPVEYLQRHHSRKALPSHMC